jgi:hypothetical protein
MTETKYIASLGQVLSVTTGRLVCEMGEIYGILNAITGDNLFAHVLPRANKFAAPLILAKFPALALADSDESNARLSELISAAKSLPGDIRSNCNEAVSEWLREMRNLGIPDSFEINCHSDYWISYDPVSELVGLAGPEKVIIA